MRPEDRKREGIANLPDDLPMLLEVNTAAEIIGTTPKAVRSLLRRGELKGAKLGGMWRVNRDALLASLGLA